VLHPHGNENSRVSLRNGSFNSLIELFKGTVNGFSDVDTCLKKSVSRLKDVRSPGSLFELLVRPTVFALSL
jgi:hypothetical protein